MKQLCDQEDPNEKEEEEAVLLVPRKSKNQKSIPVGPYQNKIQKPSHAMLNRHRNSKYMLNTTPNFLQLAKEYPFFAQYVNEQGSLDWKNAEAVMNLTKVLLKHDFDIEWSLPLDHLCPPVTNRANYIHWLNDLLELEKSNETTMSTITTSTELDRPIVGIDVGTGASCIYPLLGHKMYQWKFIATDISEESLKIAHENIMKNNESFQQSVYLVHVDESSQDILKNILSNIESMPHEKPSWLRQLTRVDFTMCNPPFFDEDEPVNRNPKNDCRGNSNEMVTVGGEETFVKRMIEDSVFLMTHKHSMSIFENCWFSSMLGKKKTLQPLKEYIAQLNANEMKLLNSQRLIIFHTTEFVQGKTSRWGICWQFQKISSSSESSSTQIQTMNTTSSKAMVSSIAVQRDMYQTVTKGFATAGSLLNSIGNVLSKHKDFITIKSRDTLMAKIKGYLDQDTREAFEISIIQTQPKRFSVKTSYQGHGSGSATTSESVSVSFQRMYDVLSKQVFCHCV
ncbi:hypothetical protein C9374_008717 [Naegleria lovaniensis]|uniref:U6 small nuclear RNA (adenine-(43)-N(6))-methyltransferase n=1 Tax=Naegleria lovaniensis TaxID=51637 RepID=A0AA88GJS9_NAELO|nr:uncharacterized protein C9374_008717 [Naegleria lovaniensis]KAG2378095.1 hypothetical protein C9374_008717 [Naegleria lovaniensis]